MEFNAGDLFPCDDPQRAKQLIFRGYIERIQEQEPKQATEPEEKPQKPKKTTTAKAKSTKKPESKKKA